MHCNITSVFIWKKKFIHSLLSLLRIINSFVFYTLFFHWFHQQNHLIALVITVPFSNMHSFQFHFSSFLIVYHHDDEGRKINVSLLSINWILWYKLIFTVDCAQFCIRRWIGSLFFHLEWWWSIVSPRRELFRLCRCPTELEIFQYSCSRTKINNSCNTINRCIFPARSRNSSDSKLFIRAMWSSWNLENWMHFKELMVHLEKINRTHDIQAPKQLKYRGLYLTATFFALYFQDILSRISNSIGF